MHKDHPGQSADDRAADKFGGNKSLKLRVLQSAADRHDHACQRPDDGASR